MVEMRGVFAVLRGVIIYLNRSRMTFLIAVSPKESDHIVVAADTVKGNTNNYADITHVEKLNVIFIGNQIPVIITLRGCGSWGKIDFLQHLCGHLQKCVYNSLEEVI